MERFPAALILPLDPQVGGRARPSPVPSLVAQGPNGLARRPPKRARWLSEWTDGTLGKVPIVPWELES